MSSRMEAHQKTIEDTLTTEIGNLGKGFSKQKSTMLKQSDSGFTRQMEAVAEKSRGDLETRLRLGEEQEAELEETINNDAAFLAQTKVELAMQCNDFCCTKEKH